MGLVISLIKLIYGRLRGDEWRQNRSKFEIEDGITLFDNERSPCARRVRMTLLEKQARYRKVEVNLLKGEQSDPEYQKICPNRKVPALTIRNVPGLDDCTLFESNVMTEFLDRALPGPDTYPADPWERAQAKMWQDWELSIADNFWPILYTNMLGFLTRVMHTRDSYIASLNPNNSVFQRDRDIRTFDGNLRSPGELEADAVACYKALVVLENALEGKRYLVGNSFTTADLSVVPRLKMFHSAGLPISESLFPNTSQYLKRLGERSCFVESESRGARIASLVLEWLFPLVVIIGNWRSGKTFRRFDGAHLANRAKAEGMEACQLKRPVAQNSPDQIVIFDYPTASECWQVKLMLQEKGVTFSKIPCDILDLIGRTAGAGDVFRIQHGSRLVSGSRGLVDYLDSTFPNQKLIPVKPLQKATLQCWQAWEHHMAAYEMSSSIDLILLSKLLQSRFTEESVEEFLELRSDPRYTGTFGRIMTAYMSRVKPGSNLWEKLAPDYGHLVENLDLQQRADNLCLALHDRLAYLEENLEDKAYLVGSDLTMADICVYCRLLYLPHLGIKISDQKYPNVCRWLTSLNSRRHFRSIREEVDDLFGS